MSSAETAIDTARAMLLQRTLERAGWDLISVDINMVSETARIELAQGDIRVTFDARNGRAMMERERVTLRRVDHLVGSGRWRPDRLHTEFIGRQRYPGVRSGLKLFCNYLADNSAVPTLRDDVRKAVALLMR